MARTATNAADEPNAIATSGQSTTPAGPNAPTETDEPNAIATICNPEAEVVARIDGIDVSEVIRTALAAHIAARRQDPAFQAQLRQEQTLLNSLAR